MNCARLGIALLLLAGTPGCFICYDPPEPATAAPPKASATVVAVATPVPIPTAPPKPTPEVTPLAPALPFPQEEAFRDQQPVVPAIRPFKQPPVEVFPLGNGVTVYLVERHELPTVSLNIAFGGGTVDDPPGSEGRTSLCMQLLGDGTEQLDKLAFQEKVADLASSVSASSGNEQLYVSMNSLSRNVDPTLDLWVDILLHPGLRQDELDRDKRSRIEAIRQQRASPSGVASRVGNAVVWGADNPLGRPATEESINGVSVDVCRAELSGRLLPQGAKLFVVGDLTKAQVLEKIGPRLKGWSGKPGPVLKTPPAVPMKGRVFFSDIPGAAQSRVSALLPGPDRRATDFYASYLMASTLGGDFSSRINMNIREKHGYAYGAWAGFSYQKNAGLFLASGAIRADVTTEALHEMVYEMKRIREEDIGEDELAREKNGEILSLPERWATSSAVLGSYQNLLFYGLPLDYYDHYADRLRAVTVAQVHQAARKRVNLDEMKYVIIGDSKVVLPKLEQLMASGELGPGDLVKLDADGRVLP